MNNSIGEKIAFLRAKKDVTQEQLASYLHVTPQAVSNWEKSKTYPDLEAVPLIALFFDVSIDELFSFEPEHYIYELVDRYSVTLAEENFAPAEQACLRGIESGEPKKQLEAYSELTHLYYRRAVAQLQKAREVCETLIAKSRTIDPGVCLAARAQLIIYDFMDRARPPKKLLEEYDPDNRENASFEDHYLYLAACYEGHFDTEGLRAAERAMELFGDREQLLDMAAGFSMRLRDFEGLLRYAGELESAASDDGWRASAARSRFEAYDGLGRYHDAAETLRGMMELEKTEYGRRKLEEKLEKYAGEHGMSAEQR